MSPRAPCGSCCCCYLCCLLLAALLLLVLSAPLQSTKLLPSPSNCLTKQQPAHWPDLWAFEGMSAHTHQKSTDPPKVSSGLVSIFRNDGSSSPAFPPSRSSAHLPSRRSQLLSCFRRVIEHPHRCGHGIYFGHVMAETKCMSLRWVSLPSTYISGYSSNIVTLHHERPAWYASSKRALRSSSFFKRSLVWCARMVGKFTKGNGSLARPLSVIPPVIHHRHPSGLGLPFRVDLSLGSKMLDLVSRSIPGNVISFICKRSFPRLDLTMLFFKVSLCGTFRQSNLRYPLHSPGHGRHVCVISPFFLVAVVAQIILPPIMNALGKPTNYSRAFCCLVCDM